MKFKLKKSNAGFYIFPFFKISFLLFLSPIFLNFVNNFKYSVFYSNSLFMQFLYYTSFRLDYFHIFCQNIFNFKTRRWEFNYIFKFFLEYFDCFIIFIYRIYLRILDKYDNSPLLKQARKILLTIVIFLGTLVIIKNFFFKKD